jgi:hypothetical protein
MPRLGRNPPLGISFPASRVIWRSEVISFLSYFELQDSPGGWVMCLMPGQVKMG